MSKDSKPLLPERHPNNILRALAERDQAHAYLQSRFADIERIADAGARNTLEDDNLVRMVFHLVSGEMQLRALGELGLDD